MEKLDQFQEELAKKLQQCLREAGIPAELDLSQHEAIVHARVEREGRPLRVIASITDREVQPLGCGPVHPELARAKLTVAAVRPTLRIQAAAARIAGEKLTSIDSVQTEELDQTGRSAHECC
jgi:hypothetical protein